MRITRTTALVVAAALGLSAAGCASAAKPRDGGTAGGGPSPAAGPHSEAPPAPPPQSAIARQCGPPDGPGELVTIRAADGVRLAAIEAGRGNRGVVLVPELGRSGKCGWWAYAAFLARRGYHVLAFDHRCTGASGCPDGPADGNLMSDIRGAVARLRHDGTARVALLGASQGGSEVLISAARPPPGVTGVAALSADELTIPLAAAPYPPTAVAAVPRLRLPVLFAVARSDPYVTVPDTRRLLARARPAGKRLVVLSAQAGHGWDMVSPPPAGGPVPAFGWTVLAFLRRVTG